VGDVLTVGAEERHDRLALKLGCRGDDHAPGIDDLQVAATVRGQGSHEGFVVLQFAGHPAAGRHDLRDQRRGGESMDEEDERDGQESGQQRRHHRGEQCDKCGDRGASSDSHVVPLTQSNTRLVAARESGGQVSACVRSRPGQPV
jgi:hypothetical protein